MTLQEDRTTEEMPEARLWWCTQHHYIGTEGSDACDRIWPWESLEPPPCERHEFSFPQAVQQVGRRIAQLEAENAHLRQTLRQAADEIHIALQLQCDDGDTGCVERIERWLTTMREGALHI